MKVDIALDLNTIEKHKQVRTYLSVAFGSLLALPPPMSVLLTDPENRGSSSNGLCAPAAMQHPSLICHKMEQVQNRCLCRHPQTTFPLFYISVFAFICILLYCVLVFVEALVPKAPSTNANIYILRSFSWQPRNTMFIAHRLSVESIRSTAFQTVSPT